MLSRVHSIGVRLVSSPSSTLSSFLCFFFVIFVVIVLFLLLVHVLHLLLYLYLYPCVHYYNHSISLRSSPPSFFPSSCSPNCNSCSSIFVDSFPADVDECTASTPVCGIHFNCINTLGSYRCEYNHSCQGKKLMYHVFIFVKAELNPFGAKWNDKFGRPLSKCLSRYSKTQDASVVRILDTLQIIILSYDVMGSFHTKNKNDDGDDDDIMMLVMKIHHMLRNVDRCAGRMVSPCSQRFVSRRW